MRSVILGTVVPRILVWPVHAAFISSLQLPPVRERMHIVQLKVQSLVSVFRFGCAQIVVVPYCTAVVAAAHKIGLLLATLSTHTAHAEGGIGCQLTVFLVEFLGIVQVEVMVDITVVVGVDLVVVKQPVAVQVSCRYVVPAVSRSSAQLVTCQQTVLLIEKVFSTNLNATHVVTTLAVLVDSVARPYGVVAQSLAVAVTNVSSATYTAVGRKEQVIFLRSVVQTECRHRGGHNRRQYVGIVAP